MVIKWYTRAAEGGFTQGQFNLGVCYMNGTGVIVDMREAVKWYTLAAEGGNSDAQKSLGFFPDFVHGGVVDEEASN